MAGNETEDAELQQALKLSKTLSEENMPTLEQLAALEQGALTMDRLNSEGLGSKTAEEIQEEIASFTGDSIVLQAKFAPYLRHLAVDHLRNGQTSFARVLS